MALVRAERRAAPRVGRGRRRTSGSSCAENRLAAAARVAPVTVASCDGRRRCTRMNLARRARTARVQRRRPRRRRRGGGRRSSAGAQLFSHRADLAGAALRHRRSDAEVAACCRARRGRAGPSATPATKDLPAAARRRRGRRGVGALGRRRVLGAAEAAPSDVGGCVLPFRVGRTSPYARGVGRGRRRPTDGPSRLDLLAARRRRRRRGRSSARRLRLCSGSTSRAAPRRPRRRQRRGGGRGGREVREAAWPRTTPPGATGRGFADEALGVAPLGGRPL